MFIENECPGFMRPRRGRIITINVISINILPFQGRIRIIQSIQINIHPYVQFQICLKILCILL